MMVKLVILGFMIACLFVIIVRHMMIIRHELKQVDRLLEARDAEYRLNGEPTSISEWERCAQLSREASLARRNGVKNGKA